jgi:acyl-CoA synthetase (AMP-forming)/AMP-acid ligase II
MTEDDVTLISGPIFHMSHGSFGPHQLVSGGKCVIMKSFKAEECLKLMEEHKVSRMFALPTAFNWILGLSDEERDKYDLRSVTFLCSSGSPLHRDSKVNLMELFPNADLHDFYGATEIGVCTNINLRKNMSKIDSVGHLAFDAEVRIVDDEGNDVPVGESGTLYKKNIDSEFYNNPEGTAANRMGEWFTAGDMLRCDEDGYYYIVDRKADMIISGGENVYPAEVEKILYTYPKIIEAAVIGIPDERWGESVKAIVVLRDGETATSEDVMDFCTGKLAGYKKPRSIDIVDELPKNPMGKILKRVLREKYWDKGGTQVN